MSKAINETVIAVARSHFSCGSFGVITLAEAVGVHYTTVYNWLRAGNLAKQKPERQRTPEDALCIQLADLKADPPEAYTEAWKAILENLRSKSPDLKLAQWVIEQFEEANLAKLEVAVASKEKHGEAPK